MGKNTAFPRLVYFFNFGLSRKHACQTGAYLCCMKDILIDFNVKFALEKVWKWKWWLLGACLVSGAITFFATKRLHDEFMSEASFIPPEIASLTGMSYNFGETKGGPYVADEEDIDRTVDYLTSKNVTDSIARKFNLYEHYGINPNNPAKDKMFYQYFKSKNVISFTTRMTVSVECYDVDPQMASNIARSYLEFANDWFEKIADRESRIGLLDSTFDAFGIRRDLILDSLATLRDKYKIYRVDLASGDVANILGSQIRNNPDFNRNYDRMVSLEMQLKMLEEHMEDLRKEYIARKLKLDEQPSLIHITKHPSPSTFKARPKRSIYVILAMFATFFFGTFVIMVIDRRRDKLPV